jgi:hypothetical protein
MPSASYRSVVAPSGRAARVRCGAAWAAVLGLGCSGGADVVTILGAVPTESGGHCEPALGRSEAPLSVVDRSLLGAPVGYANDPTLASREVELVRSLQARREVAWGIAARLLEPLPLNSRFGAERNASLPIWQTWHNKDDLTRIFRRLYPELSPEARSSRSALPASALEAAWAWNDDAVADFDTWTAERLDAYRAAVDAGSKLAGLGGVQRVAYSPAASRHALESYAETLACREGEDPPASPPLTDSPSLPGSCAQAPSFEPACLAGQFPASAVVVKASWQRLDAGTPFYAFDTSAESLTHKLSPTGEFSWGSGDRQASPGEDSMYTIELPNGNRFGLAGLHIMTKELEHWVWVTLWWSDAPALDFGADRPVGFPAAFAHYKLCSVVAFEEEDPDPAAAFRTRAPSLAEALAATSAGAGAPSWCANPYIETGVGNASTNCIGCHQHGGTGLRSEDVLDDQNTYPDFGRYPQRTTFPADYVFSLRVGDDIGSMFDETEDHFSDAP